LNNYELMLVTPTSLSKEQEEGFFKKTEEIIKKNKGKITSKKPMGKKKLAYPISGQNEAIYTVIELEGEGKAVFELEKSLRISGEVLRHGIFKLDKKEKK